MRASPKEGTASSPCWGRARSRGMLEGQEGISHPALGQHLWALHSPCTPLPSATAGLLLPCWGARGPHESSLGPAQPLWGSHATGKLFWGLATIPPHPQEQAPCLPPVAQRLRSGFLRSLLVPARPTEGPPGHLGRWGGQAGLEFCQLRLCWERTPPLHQGGALLWWLGTAGPRAPISLGFPLNQRASRGTANTHEPSAGQKDAAGGRKCPN